MTSEPAQHMPAQHTPERRASAQHTHEKRRRGSLTAQRLDPLGTYSVRMLMPACALIAIVYAAFSTAWHADQIGQWPLAWLALGLVAAASAALVWGARTRRSPFAGGWFVAMVVLSVLGSLSFTAATWGHDRLAQDDWGQISVAVLLLSTGQLRPTRDVVIAGLGAGAVLGAAAAAQADTFAIWVAPGIYAVVAATPTIALAFGAAAYARQQVRATDRWQQRARAGMARLEPQVRESVERSVQQEYVTTLNQAAAPLFERILNLGETTLSDSRTAADIARELRTRAVDTIEQSWLHNLLERARTLNAMPPNATPLNATTPHPMTLAAHGERATLDAVTADQRAVVGALLFTLLRTTDATAASHARVEIRAASEPAPPKPAPFIRARPASQRARLELVATGAFGAAREARAVRRQLMSYLSVLRVTSREARLKVSSERIEVGFSYDVDN